MVSSKLHFSRADAMSTAVALSLPYLQCSVGCSVIQCGNIKWGASRLMPQLT